MMMTGCDLSAITKPWEVQSKVGNLHRHHLMMGEKNRKSEIIRHNHVEWVCIQIRGWFDRWL